MDEAHVGDGEQHLEYRAHPGLEQLEIRLLLLGGRRAEGDAAQTEQRGLLCAGQRAGVPDGVAEVRADIDAREHDVDLLPQRGAEHDAVARGSVHPVRFDLGQGRALVAERPRGRNGVAGRGHFDVRGDHPDLAKAGSHLRQGGYAGAIDAVVIRDEDAHGPIQRC